MPEISFNPKALGAVATDHNGNVRWIEGQCAFVPIVVDGVGVEAVIEGLRLAHIEGFNMRSRDVSNGWDEPPDDVNPR